MIIAGRIGTVTLSMCLCDCHCFVIRILLLLLRLRLMVVVRVDMGSDLLIGACHDLLVGSLAAPSLSRVGAVST